MNKAVKGDFIGFTYGGVHFSGHGLMRVSDGSRYSTYLLPSINNKSVQIPGKDGSYFFNSNFGNMEFSISVAYDSVTETDMRKIKQLLGDKKPHALWFDENPYKEYIAKVSKPPQFKWICFDESKNIYRDIDGVSREEMTRLYKGEGVINFTCHTPYARSRVNFLDDQVDSVLWGYGRGSGRDYVLTQINARYDGQIFCKEGISLLETPFKKLESGEYKNYDEIFYNGYKEGATSFTCCKLQDANYVGGRYYYKNNQLTEIKINQSITRSEFLSKTFYISKPNNTYKIPIYIEINELGAGVAYWDDKGRTDSEAGLWDENLGGPELGVRKQGYQVQLTPLTLEFNYNFNEWKKASGLRYKNFTPNTEYNKFYTDVSTSEDEETIYTRAYLYNAGDVDSNLKIYCPVKQNDKEVREFPGGTFWLYRTTIDNDEIPLAEPIGFIKLNEFTLRDNDDGFIIDSKLKLILGTHAKTVGPGKETTVADQELTGSYYNKFHIGGDFFKLPPTGENEYLILASSLKVDEYPMQVEYRHTYY